MSEKSSRTINRTPYYSLGPEVDSQIISAVLKELEDNFRIVSQPTIFGRLVEYLLLDNRSPKSLQDIANEIYPGDPSGPRAVQMKLSRLARKLEEKLHHK